MSQKKKEFDSLVQKARKDLPAKSPEGLVKMLEILCEKINEEDLEFFDPEILSEMAVSHWEMAKERGKGEPKLRIYSSIVEGSEYRKTVIDIVSDDLAFLVDSIAAEINRHNILIGILIHPNIYSSYDKKGNLKGITAKAVQDDCFRQAHIHVQINETLSEQAIKDLQEGLYTALNDVFYANSDWHAMLAKLKEASSALNGARTRRPAAEIQEYCAFLDYLSDNNFTLLGYREYRFVDGKHGIYSKTVNGASLGLLHNDVSPAYITETEEGLPRNLQAPSEAKTSWHAADSQAEN